MCSKHYSCSCSLVYQEKLKLCSRHCITPEDHIQCRMCADFIHQDFDEFFDGKVQLGLWSCGYIYITVFHQRIHTAVEGAQISYIRILNSFMA